MSEISGDVLMYAAGIVLSLLFTYFPGLNTWYTTQSDELKRLLMLGLVVIVAASIFGLGCAGLLPELFGLAVTCDQAGILGLVIAIIQAMVANQMAHSIFPKPESVKQLKAYQQGRSDLSLGRG